MLRKLFFVGLISLNIFFAVPALAQDQTAQFKLAPEFNPLCWKKAPCEAKRKELNSEAKKDEGFITLPDPSADPCVGGTGDDGPWGKCLPANIAKTEIAFGGQSEFLNMGVFLSNGYKLALSVASILAAIMIIMAGFQWTTSGGNSEIISSAKKRITGSIVGLFIAYTSYFILNTINPDLVNLRLPNAWMLRPQAEIPKFCSSFPVPDDPTAGMFHQIFTDSDQKSPVPTGQSVDYELSYVDVINGGDPSGTTSGKNCGYRYLSKNGGAFACFGDSCGEGSGQSCMNVHLDDPTNKDYKCDSGTIIGVVSANYLSPPTCLGSAIAGAEYNPSVSDGTIVPICKEGTKINPNFFRKLGKFDSKKISDQQQIYKITDFSPGSFMCGSMLSTPKEQVPIGYALSLAVSRNCGFIPTAYWHLVGSNGADLNKLYTVEAGFDVTATDLFSEADLMRGGIVNNIDVATFKIGQGIAPP